MTQAEILEKRIATASRRYAAALEDAGRWIKFELSNVIENSPTFEPSGPSHFAELIRLNGELSALLFLKDQIENQAREAIAK